MFVCYAVLMSLADMIITTVATFAGGAGMCALAYAIAYFDAKRIEKSVKKEFNR